MFNGNGSFWSWFRGEDAGEPLYLRYQAVEELHLCGPVAIPLGGEEDL